MWLGEPLVLDGGLATELEARGLDLSGGLWSARLLADAPEEIVAAHLAFFRAGADVAITASYQASFPGFAALGVGRAEAARLLRRSVALARRASARAADEGESEAGRRRWVAASVGPYGAMLADGSEYRGRYGLSKRELVAFHRPRLEALAEASPDVFALESVPDVEEADALLDALETVGIPAWLSYTVAGGLTRAGTPLAEAFAIADGRPEILAVGVNCCSPDDISGALEIAGEVSESGGKPFVVYPNSGEGWDAARGSWTPPVTFDPGAAAGWVASGARLVGGCCRVGPALIADVRAASRRSAG